MNKEQKELHAKMMRSMYKFSRSLDKTNEIELRIKTALMLSMIELSKKIKFIISKPRTIEIIHKKCKIEAILN